MLNKIYSKIINFIKNNYKEIIFLLIIAFVCFYQLPYFIYKPGGSINLASRVEVDGKNDITGSYSMNYVTVAKGNIPNYLLSFLIKDWELVKEETLTVGYTDYDTSFKLEQLDYQNSIFLAIYNACKNELCSINVSKHEMNVVYIADEAQTDLELLDVITAIDGKNFDNLNNLIEYVSSKKPGDVLNLTVLKNNKEYKRTATVFDYQGKSIIGISVYITYEYTTDPKIEIKTRNSEAGSSGGLMLTLALYDNLTEEDIAKNRRIMGTGTINENGEIGAIGGVKYKMLGAKKDKADIFFVPMDNCEEANQVKKEYKIKYDVKCVETFDETVEYLMNTN